MTDEEKELERKLKEAKAKLESPFAVVGQAGPPVKRGPGRPRKQSNFNIPEADVSGAGDSKEVALEQRLQQINRPASDSNPESMREWADKEIHGLLPEAVASLAWDVRYGDAKARAEARAEILRATGVDKKEAGAFGKGGQIVINVGNANGVQGITLPYLQRDINASAPVPSNPVVERLSEGAERKASNGANKKEEP